MKYSMIVAAALLGATSGSAGAIPPHAPAPHAPGPHASVSRVRQPAGPPTKASSFVPHQLNTHVFGAPIQPPILFRSAARRNGPKS
ncbi:MAG: hypothetical protein JOY91_07365 [Sinobacteraceae bacterium]|nr:hypothetical protein [Nevskiaceae bacterium]